MSSYGIFKPQRMNPQKSKSGYANRMAQAAGAKKRRKGSLGRISASALLPPSSAPSLIGRKRKMEHTTRNEPTNTSPPRKKRRASSAPEQSQSPSSKKSKSANEMPAVPLFDLIIELLNIGKISYANSKKQIRRILSKEHNLDSKLLKKNPEFDAAIEKLVDSLQSDGEQEEEQQDKEPKEEPAEVMYTKAPSVEPSTPRARAILSYTSGCPLHGMGSNMSFIQSSTTVSMLCRECVGSTISEMPLPDPVPSEPARSLEGKVALVATLKLLEHQRLSEQIESADLEAAEFCDINNTTLKLLGVRGEQDRVQILKLIRDLTKVPE